MLDLSVSLKISMLRPFLMIYRRCHGKMLHNMKNPNLCWQLWKSFYLQVLNRHAPFRRMRIRGNSPLWNPLPADNFKEYKKKHTPNNNAIL